MHTSVRVKVCVCVKLSQQNELGALSTYNPEQELDKALTQHLV